MRISRVHLRTPDDPSMSEHLSELDINEIKVEVPAQIRELAELFKIWQEGIVDSERRLGRYVIPGAISHNGLANAMQRAQMAITSGCKRLYIIF